MKLNEYIDGARRTESSLMPLADSVTELGLTNRMYHGIVGICTELGEIVEAYEKSEVDFVNVAEEIGDAYWYTAVLFDELNITEDDVKDMKVISTNMTSLPLFLVAQGAEMLDKTKKTMFYGKKYSTDLLKEQIIVFYISLGMCVNGLDSYLDVTKEKIWEINLNKLKIRYPEKFNLNDAEVRDLKTERIELEKAK
jgi:hypothetical protein